MVGPASHAEVCTLLVLGFAAVIEEALVGPCRRSMGCIARPHSPHRSIPPESSQKRRPALECLRLSLMASRAESTHSRGTPESGTGTCTHSSWGRAILTCRFLYPRLPSGPISET